MHDKKPHASTESAASKPTEPSTGPASPTTPPSHRDTNESSNTLTGLAFSSSQRGSIPFQDRYQHRFSIVDSGHLAGLLTATQADILRALPPEQLVNPADPTVRIQIDTIEKILAASELLTQQISLGRELGTLSAKEERQLLALKDLNKITTASFELTRRNTTASSKIQEAAVDAIITATAAATQRLSAADLTQDPSMLHLAEGLHRAISTHRTVLINEGAKHAIPEAVTVEPSCGRDSIIEAGLKVARIPPPLHELIKRNQEVRKLSEKLYARAVATLE